MNLQKLGAEHTIDVDLLPKAPKILDAGCRGFEFDLELLKLRPAAKIIALDPDPTIDKSPDRRIAFIRAALTEKDVKSVCWQGPSGDGAFIIGGENDPGFRWPVHDAASVAEVANVTLKQIMDEFKIAHFDLVKLDCEGSEFGLLESWPGPIATQISVEFHDCMNRTRWNEEYFERLFSGPLRDYDRALWGLTPLGPANTLSHWDTVLVKK